RGAEHTLALKDRDRCACWLILTATVETEAIQRDARWGSRRLHRARTENAWRRWPHIHGHRRRRAARLVIERLLRRQRVAPHDEVARRRPVPARIHGTSAADRARAIEQRYARTGDTGSAEDDVA